MQKIYFACIGIFLSHVWMSASTVNDSIVKQLILDEVVITTQKETFRLQELPASVSILSERMLEQDGLHSLKNISAFVPNLYMPDYGSKLNSPIYIRGIGSRINSPSVGLYVDGVPYFEATAFDFDFFDIENIEVLRGPQGTLYGRNTMGGIINVNTRSALNQRGNTLRLTGGNYGNFKTNFTNYSQIGSRLGIATGISFYRHGGYFTNAYTNKKADRQNNGSARLRLTYKHSERTRSDLHASFEQNQQEGYPYGVLNKTTGKVDSVSYNDKSGYKRSLLSAGYQFAHEARWGNIRSMTGYQYTKDRQSVDQDFSPRSIFFVEQNQKQHMLSQEVIAQSGLQNNYRWVTGVFGFFQQTDKTVDIHAKTPNTHSWKTYDQPIYGLAAFHQSSYNNLFVKGLSATLGMRLDYEYAKQDYTHDAITPDTQKQVEKSDATLNFTEFLPKGTLRYEYARQMVYTSVSKGYKTGGFNTTFEAAEEQTFKPETSWNYELGLKFRLPGQTTLETSIFYIDWNNQQITQSLVSKVGTLITNAGRSESKGVEVSLQTQPVRNLTVNLNYGYTHAVFKDYIYTKYNTQTQSVDSADYAGHYIPQVPRHTLSLGATYRIPVAKKLLDDITCHALYTGVGKIYWYDNNRVSQPFYGLVNANIAFTKNQFQVMLWSKNILNQDYLAYYFESGNAFAQGGRPMTWGVDVKVKF